MVAIEMTDEGPAVDPLDGVSVHPAAELFPLMQGQAFVDLVADIAEHGLRDPVVMTPDGQLLDGRNRWRACAKAGVTPHRRVETGEPWTYVISTNVHRRHLNEGQRAMIAAKVAQRRAGGDRRSPDWRTKSSDDGLVVPPTQQRVAEILNISTSAVSRAKAVRRDGSPTLQDAVEQGRIPVYTAARVARDLPFELQDDFVRRVEDGVEPTKLAAHLQVTSDWGVRPSVVAREVSEHAAARDPGRHRYVTAAALRSLSDSLDALRIVLGSTDGLDPAITPEEAARWVDGLSKGRRSLHGVVKLLTERKESTP